ncbi:MAG: hypothetical protein JWQ25_536, partial [Daejeonella sp.]|nr:hypothetical protein [Daejeonella sp.]
YSANEVHATQGGFSGKLLDGVYEDFYLTKNLKERGVFSKGIKTGRWMSWSENGSLNETINWRNGEKAGRYAKYDGSGKLTEKGRYRNDLLDRKQVMIANDSLKIIYYRKGSIYIKKNILKNYLTRQVKRLKKPSNE